MDESLGHLLTDPRLGLLYHQAAIEQLFIDPMLMHDLDKVLRSLCVSENEDAWLFRIWSLCVDDQDFELVLEDDEMGHKLRRLSPLRFVFDIELHHEILRETSQLLECCGPDVAQLAIADRIKSFRLHCAGKLN